MVTIVGIDPGATGGIFRLRYDLGEQVEAIMDSCSPEADETAYTLTKMCKPRMLKNLEGELASGAEAELVVVEKVNAMPGQGVTSMFTFGTRFGVLLGALHTMELNVKLVPAQTWQKAMGVSLPKGTGDHLEPKKKKNYRRKMLKAGIFEKVKATFPDVKGINKENADAALLALWGMSHLQER